MLYRLTRAGLLRPAHRASLRPELVGSLDALFQRKGGKALDLSGELRKLMLAFNRQLGTSAT